jgi:Flp pilus assembly protein TadG
MKVTVVPHPAWRRLRFSRRCDGQSLVEFAIVLPIVLLILLGIAEYGFYLQAREAVRDGVRAAARQASLCRSETAPSPASVYGGIVGTSVTTSPDLTIQWADGTKTDGTATPTTAECVAGGAVIVSTNNKTYSFSVSMPFPGVAGGIGFNIPLASLNQSAEAIIE